MGERGQDAIGLAILVAINVALWRMGPAIWQSVILPK